jgi:hypothetical protein
MHVHLEPGFLAGEEKEPESILSKDRRAQGLFFKHLTSNSQRNRQISCRLICRRRMILIISFSWRPFDSLRTGLGGSILVIDSLGVLAVQLFWIFSASWRFAFPVTDTSPNRRGWSGP